MNDKRRNTENFLPKQCFIISLSCKFVDGSYFLPGIMFKLTVTLDMNDKNHAYWQKIFLNFCNADRKDLFFRGSDNDSKIVLNVCQMVPNHSIGYKWLMNGPWGLQIDSSNIPKWSEIHTKWSHITPKWYWKTNNW